MQTINKDLNMLEQLREQKKLLRSIRLRKEELKALEGRRKALEALKRVATDRIELSNVNESAAAEDSLKPDESVFKPFRKPENAAAESESQRESEQKKMMNFFELLMEKRIQKESSAMHKDEVVPLSAKKATTTPQSAIAHQPLLRKTFKHSNSNELNTSAREDSLVLFKKNKSDNTDLMQASFSSLSANLEPTSQIEKSKQTVRHYEEMIKKNSVGSGSVKFEKEFDGLLKSMANEPISEQPIKTKQAKFEQEVGEFVDKEKKQELKAKMADLAESEKKLS